MKITKTSKIDATRAFRVFKALGNLDVMKNTANRATFAVGTTHKRRHEIMELPASLPVEVISVWKLKVTGFLKLLPIPKPLEFIIKINDATCISELASRLDLFLLIGIYNLDAKLVPDFVSSAQGGGWFGSLERVIEPDNNSLSYIVDFDNKESDTGIMEYWTYDSSLTNELALYV